MIVINRLKIMGFHFAGRRTGWAGRLRQTAPNRPPALVVLPKPVEGSRLFQLQGEEGKQDSKIRLKPERVILVKLGMRSMSVSGAASTVSFLKMLQKTRGKLQQGGMQCSSSPFFCKLFQFFRSGLSD